MVAYLNFSLGARSYSLCASNRADIVMAAGSVIKRSQQRAEGQNRKPPGGQAAPQQTGNLPHDGFG